MEQFVKLENVKKIYKMGEVEIAAANGINFEIKKGEFAVVVGASGAGKTTVLNILGGMDSATSGNVYVDGENIASYSQKQLTKYRRDDIGFVFQFYNLVPNLTALENVELALQICKDSLDAKQVLEEVGLGERVKADRPKDLIRNSIVTPSLAAAIFNGKYVNAIPLYRMEQDFKRNGLNLSRQTMANWTIKLAEEYLSLFYDELHKELYKTHVLHADETPVFVSKDGRKAGSKSYMWVYRTGGYDNNNQIVLYDYQKTRRTDHPREFLKNFKGVLVTDGYQVYHTLEKEKDDFTVAGCWAHARRKFADIVKALKTPDFKGEVLMSQEVLKRIGDIYTLDNRLNNLSPEERQKRRQDSIKPLVEALFAWIKEHRHEVTPNSQCGKAFNYCINQEKYLKEFLNNGEIPLDNNSAERAIRGFCIGKKNWVLIDTVNGAKASAIIYSIAETAKVNHLRTYHYFEYLLTEILEHMDDKNTDFLKDLLPWSPTLPDNLKFK